ncbi:Cyclic nucleotide-binding domain-containing protein [Heracleum sosnowskyi]|uniref:Cyclic nucleotide-binding domain-containing protein n=1 Tax=Heracleum sosnowskyi TaxID=360622 RepID=A0AAD8IKU4_9APIA|nr:Cyclic nucleotide-binding domain-containing protein [Heracleum sosnowskyi]
MHSASSISIPMTSMASNDQVFPSSHSEDAENNLGGRSFSSPHPRIMNPYSKIVQYWSKVFIFLFLFSFLLQALFIFLQHVDPDNNCIVDNSSLGDVLFQLLGLTNFIFLYHVFFRFRVAYVDPESRVLVYDRKKVALNYLCGYFIIDLFFVLPLTQYILGSIREMSSWSSGLFEVVYFLLYLAVLRRLLSMFADQSTNGFKFESWSSKFFTNLLAFFLFSHVVGSFWYYFALNRVDRCLRNACGQPWCIKYISCVPVNENGIFRDDLTLWKNNNNATACFGPGGFDYGIFVPAVSLMKKSDLSVRYIYSLFWGFQQISTLAGNQTPSFFVVEVLFTMFITATGLLMFSLLIGNIQSFFQALGRRSLEKSVRGLDVEQWMSHRQLPEELKSQIRESERYNWFATRGVNELMLLENLPEDLQRDVRRHLFKFAEKFPIFAMMDERILDAIRERMKQKTYITGSKILVHGGFIDNIVFIVRGKLESIGEDNNLVHLSEGDVCGEELVTLCLEHSSLYRDEGRTRIPAQKFLCKRMVRCLTNVEAFTVRATDLEEVFTSYSGFSG